MAKLCPKCFGEHAVGIICPGRNDRPTSAQVREKVFPKSPALIQAALKTAKPKFKTEKVVTTRTAKQLVAALDLPAGTEKEWEVRSTPTFNPKCPACIERRRQTKEAVKRYRGRKANE